MIEYENIHDKQKEIIDQAMEIGELKVKTAIMKLINDFNSLDKIKEYLGV